MTESSETFKRAARSRTALSVTVSGAVLGFDDGTWGIVVSNGVVVLDVGAGAAVSAEFPGSPQAAATRATTARRTVLFSNIENTSYLRRSKHGTRFPLPNL
jgi:hypothetical protein